MERNKILQVLVPAGAAAAVVVLIGVLVAMSDWGGGSSGAPPKGKTTVENMDDSGMSDTLPPLDAPEWKAGPGLMKVWDVQEGDGGPCPPGATVTFHYTGWTKDGKVFDSSRRNLSPRGGDGSPVTFELGGLIKGWQEGIPGMKSGGIRRLIIPYDWAYGEQGRPPSIPPRADLVFEVKLLRFK